MSIVLFNPTNETMRVTFSGRHFFLKPDSRTKVDDACGKHVLNEYSQRGLCSLDYGDENKEDEIAEAGRETNRAFKIRQIEDFNEQNVARKATGLPYNHPTKTIIEYAKELSLKLEESYRVDDTVAKESKELRAENDDLKTRLDYVQTQHNKLAEKMNRVLEELEARDTAEKEIDPTKTTKRGRPPKVKDGG